MPNTSDRCEISPSVRFSCDVDSGCSVTINLALVLAGGAFYEYGINGSPLPLTIDLVSNPFHALLNWGTHGLTVGIFMLLLWVGTSKATRDTFEISVGVNRRDGVNLVIYLAMLIFVFRRDLLLPLVGDELVHAQSSLLHTFYPLLRVGKILPSAILSLPGWLVVWVANIALACFAIVTIRKLRTLAPRNLLLVSLALFMTAKLVALGAGAGDSQHPALRLFPLWMAGTLLSPSVFAYRFISVLALAVTLCLIERQVRERWGPVLSLIFGLAVGTAPCLLSTAVIVEQSIWTALLWTMLMLHIASRSVRDLSSREFLISASCAIAVTTLMRQSAFLAFVPISVLIGIFVWRERLPLSFRALVLFLCPALLFLPFLAKSILLGTAATYQFGEFGVVGRDLGAFARVCAAVTLGVVRQAWANALYPWGAALVLLALVPLRKCDWLKSVLYGLLLSISVYVFFSIRPILWGNPRYQAEYLTPFVAVGIFRVIEIVMQTSWKSRGWISALVLTTISMANINAYSNLAAANVAVDRRQALPYWKLKCVSENFYDYRSAFEAAKTRGIDANLFVIDNGHGVLSSLLYGYDFRSILSQYEIYRSHKTALTERLVATVSADSRVTGILIVDRGGRELMEEFCANGWDLFGRFVDEKNGSTIFGLTRK